GRAASLPSLPRVLARPGCWTLVRYLPRRRCTLRLESARQGTRYFKVYPDDRGRPAHEAGRSLWRAAREGQLEFDVPRPDRWDAANRSLIQYALDGAPVARDLCGPCGAAMARRIGRANA